MKIKLSDEKKEMIKDWLEEGIYLHRCPFESSFTVEEFEEEYCNPICDSKWPDLEEKCPCQKHLVSEVIEYAKELIK